MLSLNSAFDLLDKCKYDVDKLLKISSSPEYDYSMFDTILSLNHLFEWFLKDKTIPENKRMDCIKEFNPFQTLCDVSAAFKQLYLKLNPFPISNEAQLQIRLLCNKAKHFKIKPTVDQKKDYLFYLSSGISLGEEKACLGYFEKYKYFVEIKGKDINLEFLIVDLLEKWVAFGKKK